MTFVPVRPLRFSDYPATSLFMLCGSLLLTFSLLAQGPRLLGDYAALVLPLLILAAALFPERLRGESSLTLGLYGGALAALVALPLATNALEAQLLLEGYALCSYALLACGGRGQRLTTAVFGEGDLSLTLRYFSVSALASLLLLSGWALFLAAYGSLEFTAPARLLAVAAGPELFAAPGATAALACLLGGLSLKLALAPLHLWAPAVYGRLEGRLYVFFLALAKPLLLLFLGQLLVAGALLAAPGSASLLEALALASLLVGSLGALGQRSLRTLFFYSSMANGGFLLLALGTGVEVTELSEAFCQYLIAYAMANGAALWWF
jgi:NADH-quinone oxidoreductase subunit N